MLSRHTNNSVCLLIEQNSQTLIYVTLKVLIKIGIQLHRCGVSSGGSSSGGGRICVDNVVFLLYDLSLTAVIISPSQFVPLQVSHCFAFLFEADSPILCMMSHGLASTGVVPAVAVPLVAGLVALEWYHL